MNAKAKPFIKWVGGKRSVLPELLKRLPNTYDEYFEPFIGGGALFFELQPKKAHISDVNPYLIHTYKSVRDHHSSLVTLLTQHKKNHCKEYYLLKRKELSQEQDSIKIAALFIYINKTCFNGLYRVNKSGGFNVPMGSYKNPKIVDSETLTQCSGVLYDVDVTQHGFEQVRVLSNAFYYLDPPYHKTYAQYDNSEFKEDKHIKLSEFCKEIDSKGGHFMLSNSNTEFVQDLYKGFHIEEILASRSVSCKGNQRGKEGELVIRNYI